MKIERGNNAYRKEGAVNIVIVAGLYDRYIKGMQFLLPVMQRLLKEAYPVVLHIIGDGDYRQEFEQKACDLDIREHCVFYGYCEKEKLYSILHEMDFSVCASIFESFSCATAEAMMCGKPVVATKCGGPDSIVTKDTGILVEKESEQALYEGMVKMISNYRNYSPKAIEAYACNKFSVENICRQYLLIYDHVSKKREKK